MQRKVAVVIGEVEARHDVGCRDDSASAGCYGEMAAMKLSRSCLALPMRRRLRLP